MFLLIHDVFTEFSRGFILCFVNVHDPRAVIRKKEISKWSGQPDLNYVKISFYFCVHWNETRSSSSSANVEDRFVLVRAVELALVAPFAALSSRPNPIEMAPYSIGLPASTITWE